MIESEITVTPMFVAAENGHDVVVGQLLATGAEKDKGHSYRDAPCPDTRVPPLVSARCKGYLHIAAPLGAWAPAHAAVAAARAAMQGQPFTVLFLGGDAAELPAPRWMVSVPAAPPPGMRAVTDATGECAAAFAGGSAPVDLKALLIELHFAVAGDGATPAAVRQANLTWC